MWLRRLLITTTTIFTASIIITHPASGSGARSALVRTVAPAATSMHITVEPTFLTIDAPRSATAPHLPPQLTPAFTTGADSASMEVVVRVRVLPGRAQWQADATLTDTSSKDVRILAGKVLYAIGDNHAWQLVARVTGADGHAVTPQCTSAYQPTWGNTSTVVTGDRVTIGDAPIVVCEGTPGNSGGIFTAALDLDAPVSDDIVVTVELIP